MAALAVGAVYTGLSAREILSQSWRPAQRNKARSKGQPLGPDQQGFSLAPRETGQAGADSGEFFTKASSIRRGLQCAVGVLKGRTKKTRSCPLRKD